MPSTLHEKIYAVVRRVPRGRVATYGQVAMMAGFPRHARHVGFALRALPERSKVPWHRILNSRGEVSPRAVPSFDEIQRQLLEEEGIEFSPAGRIDLERYRWEDDVDDFEI